MPPEEKKPNSLADSLLAGLAQDSADPDAADARFMERAAAIDDEDRHDLGPPAKGGEDEEDEDDDEGGRR